MLGENISKTEYGDRVQTCVSITQKALRAADFIAPTEAIEILTLLGDHPTSYHPAKKATLEMKGQDDHSQMVLNIWKKKCTACIGGILTGKNCPRCVVISYGRTWR